MMLMNNDNALNNRVNGTIDSVNDQIDEDYRRYQHNRSREDGESALEAEYLKNAINITDLPDHNDPITHEVMNTSKIFRGMIFDVLESNILVNDRKITRQIVDHAPVVYILVQRQDGRYLIVHEYRAGVDRVCTGLPAGFINAGEEPKHAAIRELAEETGVVVNALDVDKIGEWESSQGFTNERAYVYRANVFHPNTVDRNLDSDEIVSYEWVEWKTLGKMVRTGEINGAATVAVIQHEALRLLKKTIGIGDNDSNLMNDLNEIIEGISDDDE